MSSISAIIVLVVIASFSIFLAVRLGMINFNFVKGLFHKQKRKAQYSNHYKKI